MVMRKRILKARRDRWVTLVIRRGETLDKLYEYRAGLRPEYHPDECRYVEQQINRVERSRDRLLQRIKETA